MSLFLGSDSHLYCQVEAEETVTFNAYDASLRYYACFIHIVIVSPTYQFTLDKIIVKFP